MMCGGVGGANLADDKIQTICDEVRGKHEEAAGKKFAEYKAHSYATQVVAGTNYFVKVHVGGGVYEHVRIYQALPHTGAGPEFTSHQSNKTQEDNLGHF